MMSWEGIIIEPSEIAVQTAEMTNALEQDNESLQTALRRLTGFQTEEELSSLAWNSLKGRAAYLCLILQGLICANEAMIEDNRQLNNLTDSILGNEPFYGESIAAVLTFQQGIMATYERRVTNLQRISRRMIGARLSTALVERSLVQAKEIVSSAQQIIAQCMEQRERVEQFLSATANLYEYADALYSNVAQGITALEQSGASVDSAVPAMSWTQALNGAWEERRLKRLDSGNVSASVTDGKAMPHLIAGVFRVMEEYETDGMDSAGGGTQNAVINSVTKVLNAMEEQEENRMEQERDSIPVHLQKYYDHNLALISQIEQLNENHMFDYDIYNFKKIYDENREVYNELSLQTNVPPELIAAIHYRESAGNFNTYLHNGQALGTPTTIIPQGRLFYDFSEAAIDALNGTQREKGIYLSCDSSLALMMTFTEVYNGTGYTDYRDIACPYLYSGTDIYTSGKYTSDHYFDSEAIDRQPGVYLLIMSLREEEK